MTEQNQPDEFDVFDVDRIRRLIELMEQHELSAIDLRGKGQRIRLSRGNPAPLMMAAPTVSAAPAAPPTISVASPAAASAAEGANIVTIKSPMVGTFYTRQNPESEPFVKVGSTVEADTTICIVEAMKVFNEIPAEIRGKIVAVLVENGKPVEFGKPLFKVDTNG